MIAVSRTEAFVFRYPLAVPVRTSFGEMRSRPMLLVKVTDRDGACGWGEIWCNFPAAGAEHRARLVADLFAGLLAAHPFADAAAAFTELTATTRVLAIQSGEPGPFMQCIAGLDIALHDLAGKTAGLPLWRMLGGKHGRVPAYASGLNPDQPELAAAAALQAGYRSFKLKVGFGSDIDLGNLAKLRTLIGADRLLMADANQAWDLEQACACAATFKQFELAWLEEPLAADRPQQEWARLKRAAPMPIAAGENICGADGFAQATASGLVDVIQPDLAKWGGFTKVLPVARAAIAAGRRFCPHYLGGGIGLVASAHLLAAAGGDGLLEVDVNDNPLRSCCTGKLLTASPGNAVLPAVPGLGVEPDLEQLGQYLVG